jgi:FAD/FMN-containing dehydrogenase
MGAPALTFARQETSATAAGTRTLDKLAENLAGELIVPSNEAYGEARKLWNGMIDKRPAAVARCTGVADVRQVVVYARENGWPVSVRGGGHNVAGKALRDGAITIDLTPMDAVRVDPRQRLARAQGGARWGQFDRETVAFDLVTTGGAVSSTGVGGLTLGGGLGWLMRKHGLSCDNLVSADVVTADGRLILASADENPDLFWALRGGGGNFGVVTSFEFVLHHLEPIVRGSASYPESQAKDMLHFFREFTESAPDAVTAMAGFYVGQEGSPLAGQSPGWLSACHSGAVRDGERLLRPIGKFGPPVDHFIGPMPYTTLQSLADPPAGGRHYWRSNFLSELTDGVIDAIAARVGELPKPGSMMLLEHMQGAVGAVGDHDTAFSNRKARYNLSILSAWLDPQEDERNIAWTREFGDELQAFATGAGYVNYMTADEGAGRVQATYQANLERLRQIKKKYDPDNFFNSNQNIAP